LKKKSLGSPSAIEAGSEIALACVLNLTSLSEISSLLTI